MKHASRRALEVLAWGQRGKTVPGIAACDFHSLKGEEECFVAGDAEAIRRGANPYVSPALITCEDCLVRYNAAIDGQVVNPDGSVAVRPDVTK